MTTTWTTIASNSVTQSIADAAATSATAASDSASAAATSATTAAGSVTSAAAEVVLAEAQVVLATNQVALATSAGAAEVVLAAAQVTLAEAQVTLAEAQVTLATAQATAAAASASSAATHLADFNAIYHGASATAPTGVTTGDLWFDTSTGVDAMKVYDGSAFVAAFISASGMLTATNNLSDISSASSGRTNLGLVIGTNVQAYDADLAAIAGLTSAADRIAYFTGAGAASLATFSTAGRALVDDADASAQRTTLGLGTMATQGSGAIAITGGSVVGITDLLVADGGTGQSSFANGELLIGNTTGGTLAKSALTAGTGISVTNGAGVITIANSDVGSDAFYLALAVS